MLLFEKNLQRKMEEDYSNSDRKCIVKDNKIS